MSENEKQKRSDLFEDALEKLDKKEKAVVLRVASVYDAFYPWCLALFPGDAPSAKRFCTEYAFKIVELAG